MKLNALEYFVVLAESKSINKAAQKLYVTQPCLTRAIQGFEKELGVQLFSRDKSGILLTEAGEKVLPEAKQVLALYEGWKELSRQHSLQQVDMYSQSIFSHFLLPEVLFRFKKTHPEITVNLTSVLRPKQYLSPDVRRPVVALSVNSEESLSAAPVPHGNKRLVLMHGEYQCVVNAMSPLAQMESVSFEDLRDYFFVFTHVRGLTEGTHTISRMFQRLFQEIAPSRIIEVESIPNMIALLDSNTEAFSLAYYPMLTRWKAVARSELVHLPIRDQPTGGIASLFYSEQAYAQHAALRDLVAEIKGAAQTLVKGATLAG